jgi:adenylate kinase
MTNILFLARPGAGKGTQAELLAKKFNLVHLSSGNLLRQEVLSGSALGQKIKDIQASGQLVADDLIIEMIKKQLETNPGVPGFIFDGFPRTAKQAVALDEMLTLKNCPLNLVIVLEITPAEMLKRLLKRAEIEGRHDDNEKTIKARGAVYDEQTEPLINHYAAQDKIIIIDGSPTISEIAAEIEKVVARL